MRAVAVLLAGGRGDRLGGKAPKGFADLAGEPLVVRAVRAVDSCPDLEGFVLVVPAGREEQAAALVGRSPKAVAVVAGGETRQGSVGRGLQALPDGSDAVASHDVARPFASAELYARVLAALERADGVVPVVPVVDTVKRVRDGGIVETLSREELALVQTPQAFWRPALEAAHRRAEEEAFVGSDDAVLLERAGFRVTAVPGDPRNLKITEPGDLERAAAMLARG